MTTNRINAEVICLNCQHVIDANFCGNCGQKKYKRIDRKYLYDEIQYSLLHTNKGFFYSVKNILKNPGKTTRHFIEGNRVNHYKPILLAFLLSTISAFISYKVIGLNEKMSELSSVAFEKSKMQMEFFNEMMAFISSYNSFVMLAAIPIISACAAIAFMYWGQNYYEHIVMGAFFTSLYTLVNILILFPLIYIFKDSANALMTLTFLSTFMIIPLMLWFYGGFYSNHSLLQVFWRILFFIGIVTALYFVVIMAIVFGIVIFSGPEFLESFAPQGPIK